MQNKQPEKQLNNQALADRIVHHFEAQLFICELEIRIRIKVQIDFFSLCQQNQYVPVVGNVGSTKNYWRSKEQSVRRELVPAIYAITFNAAEVHQNSIQHDRGS